MAEVTASVTPPGEGRNDAFWGKAKVDTPDRCWPWIGARNVKGYGNFRSRSAHVVAYEIKNGLVPIGLEIDHVCKNRSCVNPSHLEAVTHQENVRRSQPSHCKYGHPLSGDNVRIVVQMDGVRRRCKICRSLERSRRSANHDA